ncbi:major facilitator superfamily domain-containing protein [Phthorimaea operculella]|nr:major facilitator superfamily domain-containing protein [Phthorimaea operculella]
MGGKQKEEIERLGWGVRHLQISLICLCMTSLQMVRSSMGVAVLAMTDTSRKNESITIYDWDKSTQGVILSSFFWGYMVMQLPAGILTNRFGGKPILLFALLSNGVICVLVPLLASWGGWQILCAARVLIGMTQACLYPGTHTLLGRWLPEHERTFLSSVAIGGTQLGIILGMPVSGLLASTPLGWPLIYYAMAGLMVFAAALWYFFTASTPDQHRFMTLREQEYIEQNLNKSKNDKRIPTPWLAIFKSRSLWALTIGHVGVAYGFIMFFVDLPTYLEKGLHISLKNSAALSGLPYIGMWVGGIIAAAISETLFNKGLLSAAGCRRVFQSIASVSLSVGLISLSYVGSENSSLAIVILVVSHTLAGFYSAGFMMNHLELSPNFAGLLMSITNFVANIGSIVNPLITSFLLRNEPTDLTRWRIVFLVVAGIIMSTHFIYMFFGSSNREPWDDPSFLDKTSADPEEMKPVINEEKEKEANAS